jgi:hypothetical protein
VRTTAALVGAALIAGCGASDDQRTPPPEVRAAVAAFMKDLRAGDYASACAALPADEIALIRQNALGAYRPRARTQAARLRQVQAVNASTRRCPRALALLASEIGPQRLDRVAARARTAPLSYLGPASVGTAQIADGAWTVRRHDGRWQVVGADALAVALEDATA